VKNIYTGISYLKSDKSYRLSVLDKIY